MQNRYEFEKSEHHLLLSLILNSSLTLLEFISGIFSGSAALIADGFKNLTDSILLIVAMISEEVIHHNQKRAQKIRNITAVINIIIIFIISLAILYESIEHLKEPQSINGHLITTIAVLAVVVNLIAAVIIRSKKHIASRAAFFGLLSSAFSGGCVLISGILTSLYNIRLFDFVAGIIIALTLIYVGIDLLRQNAK